MGQSAFFSQRSLLTFMALGGVVNANLMRLCLNVVILKMTDEEKRDKPNLFKHTQSTMMDGTQLFAFSVSDSQAHYEWSEQTKSFIKSAFFITYALLQVPASFLGYKYGGKTVLNLGLFLTALCTLITPIAVEYGGSSGLITLRFFMGIFEAPVYPALIILLSCWIPENERGRVSSIVFSGGQIGSIICNLITGFVLPYVKGYATLFYSFGVVGICWNIAFHFLVFSTPSSHPRIKADEKEYLQNEIGDLVETKYFCQIPWTSMLTSPAVRVLIIAQMGHDWVFYLLANEMPKYFKNIHNCKYDDLAIITSVPFLLSYLFSLICGAVCDHIVTTKLVTSTSARKIFTAIGALVSAIFTLLIFSAKLHKVAAVVFFTLAMISMGGFYTGAQANFMDLCPNFSGALIGLVNGTGAVTAILVPYIIDILTPTGYICEYEPVFWTSFLVLSTTVFTYGVWGSAEVQSWNDNTDEDNCLKRAYRRTFKVRKNSMKY